jgi:hypothetical protein
MIPEEDQPAPWLHGYGGIEADIRQLREFADRLAAEVESNHAHHETQQATTDMVYAVRGATGHLAAVADRVATQYADTDAFSAARAVDVQRALADPGTVLPGGRTPTLSDPTGPDSERPVFLP